MQQRTQLDAAQAEQVLRQSAERRGQVVIESAAFDRIKMNGFVRSCDAQALLIEITGRPPVQQPALIHARCRICLYCGGRYEFETTITSVPCWGDRRSVAVSRPAAVLEVERRRFNRAALAPSSTVTVARLHDGRLSRWTANLLNISADGMACKVGAVVGESAQPGSDVDLSFRLPGLDEEYRLSACVSNRTPTGDGGTILGLQFVRDGESGRQLEALRRVLASREPEVAYSESHA